MQFESIQIIFFIILNVSIKISSQQSHYNPRSPPDCRPSCYKSPSKDCNKFQIELRATIAPCARLISPFASTTARNTFVTEIPDDIEDLPAAQWNLKCSKKLLATLKIVNQGDTSTLNQYIIVDHVIDSVTGQRVSLLNPYVIILRQKPLLQLYGLKYRNIVNAEAREQVINKRSPNFSGCDDVSDNPTCGNVRFNGDVIPYSQGFCCSCDEKKNYRRQPRNIRDKRNSTVNIQKVIYQNTVKRRNKVKRESHYKRDRKSALFDFNDYRNRRIRPKYDKGPMIFVPQKRMEDNNEGVSYAKDIFFAPNRNNYRQKEEDDYSDEDDSDADVTEEEYHNIQIRGGQDCDEKWTSRRDANPSYHDSAHCLRFSKLWYAIYQLSDPVLEHTIFVRLFEKREKEDGGTTWVDLTAGTTIGIGSLKSKYRDKYHTLIVTYDNGLANGEPLPYSLDPKTKRLLIPQGVPKTEGGRHQEIEGGVPEYLVVDNKNVQTTGDQCDSAGVGYSAFFNQAKRCSVPRGSCLKNQPSQLWRIDKATCSRNKRGKYFLKNFAKIPDNALRRTRKGDSKYLALNFGERFKSTIEMEIKADDNIVFRAMAVAKITEVYVDSTSDTATILTIKIHNNGLTSNTFHPRLADCPLELPVDWGNLEGSPVIIPPQHHSTFSLRLLGILPVDNFYCSVEALNCKSEIVAVRRIRIVKGDRCICSWHCLCACLDTTGLGCELMSMEHYHAAGFVGSMPLTTNMVQVSYFEQALFGLCFFSILLTITLLLMGLTKGVIGLCCFTPIGIWGLDMLIGTRGLKEYYEEELADRDLVYDDDGWPVHPDTHQRSVRIVGSKLEFSLNLIFFFTYPIMLMVALCSKVCCPYYSYTGDEEDKDVFFEGVNAVVYTKCPDSRQESTSSEEEEDPFDFETESRSSRRSKSKMSRRSRRSRE